MIWNTGNPLPVLLCQCRQRFVLVASWIVLWASVLLPFSTVSAEQPAADPPPSTVQFDIRFVPREERKAVPYELVRGTVTFKALVNGHEVWAVLDNGSSSSLIDEAFARSLGLQFIPVTGGPLVTPTGVLERWRVRGGRGPRASGRSR